MLVIPGSDVSLLDMTMGKFMDRRGMEDRPHGIRSSFRDLCAELTSAPREVAEATLGHVAGSSVARAYRRTIFLQQRHALLERWANHITSAPVILSFEISQ